MATVIVFGPTGNVGSIAACTAQERGAKVWLGMRDTSKAVPGLGTEDEKTGGFERVKADLTKPESLSAAVQASGATRAFIYLAHSSADHMKAALEALHSSGIKFVVFLSSFTINTEIRDVAPSELIPYVHARVEVSLEEVFGNGNFVAVRPGAFLTSVLDRHLPGIRAGHVSMYEADWEMDCITPIDMGQVAGTILADGSRDGQQHVYLYGPQIMSAGDVAKRIGKVLGKDVEVSKLSRSEAYSRLEQSGMPTPFVEYLLRAHGRDSHEADLNRTRYEEGVQNVRKYTGRSATGLEEWLEANKNKLTS